MSVMPSNKSKNQFDKIKKETDKAKIKMNKNNKRKNNQTGVR